MAQHRPPSDASDDEPRGRAAALLDDNRPPEPLDSAHRDAVAEGLAQMRDGDIASDDEIAALYRRAGL